MYLRKVFENKKYIRLENVERDSLTVYIEGSSAYILSVSVAYEKRGMARGSELVYALEGCLFNRGVTSLNAVYYSDLLNVCDLLSVCRFSITEGSPVLTRHADDFFADPSVLKVISAKIKTDAFIPLSALNADATGKLVYLLKSKLEPFPMTYMTCFLQDVSGVVFDGQNRIAGVILCTRYDECVHMDYFIIPSKESSKYAGLLLRGFFCRLLELYEEDPFSTISIMPGNKFEEVLAKRFLGDDPDNEVQISFEALKLLSDPPERTFEIRDDEMYDESMFMRMWEREVATVPYQYNLFLKHLG